MASLLERFYDPTAGMVTLDGQDLRTLDPSWLRSQVIGFISQVKLVLSPAALEGVGAGGLSSLVLVFIHRVPAAAALPLDSVPQFKRSHGAVFLGSLTAHGIQKVKL